MDGILLNKSKLFKIEEDRLNRIWYMKYAPKTVDELLAPEDIKQKIKAIIEQPEKYLGHLLFVGIQGSGKTTTASLIVKNIIKHPADYTEFNGSRLKVEHIQDIEEFGLRRPLKSVSRILFLDEFDSASNKFYSEFRKVIEDAARFMTIIATANYIYKIPPAILSRFQIFHYNEIPFEQAFARAKWILEQEKVKYDERIVEQIVKMYLPDFRTVVQILQASTIEDPETGERVLKFKDNVFNINQQIRKELKEFIMLADFDAQRFNNIISLIRRYSAIIRPIELLDEIFMLADFELKPIILKYYNYIKDNVATLDVIFGSLLAEIMSAKRKFLSEQKNIAQQFMDTQAINQSDSGDVFFPF